MYFLTLWKVRIVGVWIGGESQFTFGVAGYSAVKLYEHPLSYMHELEHFTYAPGTSRLIEIFRIVLAPNGNPQDEIRCVLFQIQQTYNIHNNLIPRVSLLPFRWSERPWLGLVMSLLNKINETSPSL